MYVILTSKPGQFRTEPTPGLAPVEAWDYLLHDKQRARFVIAAVEGTPRIRVVEEADPALQPLVCLEETNPAERLANRLKAGFRTLLTERGVDLEYGRSLPRRLRAAGLVDVAADAYFPIGGPLNAELERATTAQIRDRLVEAGLATFEEIEEHLVNVAEGRLDLTTSPMISAWGRRPRSASRY